MYYVLKCYRRGIHGRSWHGYEKSFSFESCMFCSEIKEAEICLLAEWSYNSAVCGGPYSVLKRVYKICLLWPNFCVFVMVVNM
jgi:hypothetical protein